MSAELKILKFVGVDKKEQVLLKSFLNLARDELEFDLQIDENHASPDVIVIDEEHSQTAEDFASTALKIIIGNNSNDASDSYIHRPLQWSRFKSVLDKLDEVQQQPVTQNQQQQPVVPPTPAPAVQPANDIQDDTPKQPEMPEDLGVGQWSLEQSQEEALIEKPIEQKAEEIVVQEQPTVAQEEEPEVVEFFPGTKEHEESQFSENVGEWELEVSVQAEVTPIEQHSSEEVSVPEAEVGQLYALNDDALESPSEFLDNIEEMVIETDKVDEWEEKSATSDTELSESESFTSEEKTGEAKLDSLLEKEKASQEELLGQPLDNKIEFWSGDTEVLVNNHPVFVVMTKRGKVYTEYEPHKWYKIFSSGGMRQRKLDNKWKPYGRLQNYPIEWFVWCAHITRSKGVLSEGINKKDLFLLEKWPDFSLIQNDNNLLKLCSLAFANPESPRTLVMQSKLRARVIVGFINACHAIGLLSAHGSEEGADAKNARNNNQASSMTWFKGLFK